MTQPTSLVTFLLDKSQSMLTCKAATIEGFNAYLGVLKAEREANIEFTFLQFDTVSIDKLAVAQPVASIAPLNDATYNPRGGTPLIDAAVTTIRAIEASLALRSDKPKVVVCIQTDGEENSSTQHTWEELRGLVRAKTEQGWQFNFLGAGIDAYDQGAKMGVSAMNTMSYDHTSKAATQSGFRESASNHASFSAGRSADTSYSMAARASAGDMHAHRHFSDPSVSVAAIKPAALDLSTLGSKAAPVSPNAPAGLDLSH